MKIFELAKNAINTAKNYLPTTQENQDWIKSFKSFLRALSLSLSLYQQLGC